MNMSHVLRSARLRPAVLAVVLVGALGGTAQAAVTNLTLDPTAQLSPGALHATLTGTITCDAGDSPSFSGQIVGSKSQPGGYGTAIAVCDGTSEPYAIDVSSSAPFPFPTASGPFKAGKTSAQVTASICDYWTFVCTTKYVDGQIKLVK
ncbi:MAG: hypothetical protein QOJ35_2643 [Solirubrobacteraceae bacterium]|jgi:hypothetical protein|nr:hypothetical protein [Solirubrobacteraceae bacterium]